MCGESPAINDLKANSVKLLSMIDNSILSDSAKPINYYDDHRIEDDFPEVIKKMALVDVRYYYSLIRNFNKYFTSAVPYINNSFDKTSAP